MLLLVGSVDHIKHRPFQHIQKYVKNDGGDKVTLCYHSPCSKSLLRELTLLWYNPLSFQVVGDEAGQIQTHTISPKYFQTPPPFKLVIRLAGFQEIL